MKESRKRFAARLGCLLFFLACHELLRASLAQAWGPGVHTVTALGVLENLPAILPEIARCVTVFRPEFIYGCLAADFFIGKGGRRRRKSHPHTWEGGFQFLREACDERENAYAWGFLAHLAADVVAHNVFLPRVSRAKGVSPRMGHLYWEMQVDYHVGPQYTRLARQILSADHSQCDDLLHALSGRRWKGVRAGKHLYSQGVRFSDYLYEAHQPLLAWNKGRMRPAREVFDRMVGQSCQAVLDLLERPESALCLSFDPLGAPRELRLRRRWLKARGWWAAQRHLRAARGVSRRQL